MKKLKKNEAITLLALVVTVVVLLILAGITLTFVLGDNSVFSKASQAKIQTEIAKAREKLEMVLSEAKIYQYTEPEYNDLDEMILNKVSGSKVQGDVAIVDGYAFTLDRSIPWIGEYAGKEKDLIFPVITVAEVIQADQTDNYRTAKIEITATIDEKAKNGINRIEIWQKGAKLSTITCNNEKAVTAEYKANKNGLYTIKAFSDISGSARTTVEGIVPVVEFTPNGSTEWKKSHTATVKVKETAEKVTGMKYLWKKSDESEPQTTDLKESCTNNSSITGQGETMTGKYYLWVLVTLGTGENPKTYISRSEEFYFDNEGPNITINSSSLTTSSISISINLGDDHVKKVSSYNVYVDGKLVVSGNFTSNPVSCVANVESDGFHDIKVTGKDALGNVASEEKRHELIVYRWKKYPTKSVVTEYGLEEVSRHSGEYTLIDAYKGYKIGTDGRFSCERVHQVHDDKFG